MDPSASQSTEPERRDTPTLTEMATQALRAAILDGIYKPGQRLVERDLSEQIGVSRTCIRAALQQVEAEGLAERIPRRGLLVAFITLEEARQIYEVRQALEPMLARLFVKRADAATLTALVTAAEEVARSLEAPGEYVRSFKTFYEILHRGSGNQVARDFLRMLDGRIAYLRTLTTRRADGGRRGQTVTLLRQIAYAAETRDGPVMAERCEAFVLRSAEFAQEVLSDALAVATPTAP